MNFENQDARIEYPTPWIYKVIGSDFQQLKNAVNEVLENQPYTVEESNTSSGGNYVSIKVELTVLDENMRDRVFYDLKKHMHVKMVL